MKRKYRWNYSRHLLTLLRGLLIFFCLVSTIEAAQAQTTVRVADGYPKFTGGNRLVAYGEPLTIAYRFTPQGGPLTDAKVQLQLPNDVEVENPQVTIGGIGITKTQAGQTVTLSFNGAIPKDHEVEVQVDVKATGCITPGVVQFTVKVLSGTDSKVSANLTANAARPVLQIGLPAGGDNINFNGIPTTPKTVTTYLRTASADKASSAQVTYTVSTSEVTLSEFKLNGSPLTPTETNLPDGKRTYTLTFASPATMGGSMIDNTNSKQITFKAVGTPVICGYQKISATARFPHNGAACHTSSEQQIMLAMGGSGSTPAFSATSCQYVAANNSSAATIAPKDVPKDGSLTWVRTVFTNSSTAAIRKFSVDCRINGGLSYYGCIDTSKIFVQNGNGPLKKISPLKRYTYGFNDRKLKSSFTGMIDNFINMEVYEMIPAGQTVTLYVATHNGNVFEEPTNERFRWTGYGTPDCHSLEVFIHSIEGFCSKNTGKIKTETLPKVILPMFTNQVSINSQTCKGEQTFKRTVPITLGQIDAAPSVFTVTAPAWLSIEDLKITLNENGTGSFPATVTFTPTSHSSSKRSFKITSSASISGATRGYLHVTFKSPACVAPLTNRSDTIYYTTDQLWGSTTLTKVGYLKQGVSHICKSEGIALDTFYLKRHENSVGYKDTDNDGNPDNGTQKLPEADVNHKRFASEDEGSFHWRGKVEGSPGDPDRYEYLYLPIDGTAAVARNTVYGFIPNLSSGHVEIKVNGANKTNDATVDHTVMTGNKNYFMIRYPDKFKPGDNIEIRIDFTPAIRVNGIYTITNATLTSYFKVSENALTNPFTEGKGSDDIQVNGINAHLVKPSSISTYGGNPIVVFESRMPKTNLLFDWEATMVYLNGKFENEARYFYYVKKVTYKLPPGYTMEDQITVSKRNDPSLGTKTLTSEPGSTPSERTYDFSKLFQTDNPAGTLTGGKWRLWKDQWYLDPKVTLKINPSLVQHDTSKVVITRTFHNLRTGQDEELHSTYWPLLIWNSKANFTIDQPNTDIVSYGPYTTGPRLKLSNKTSAALNNIWFYFKGKVKDVKLIANGIEHTGINVTGTDGGCWVNVPNLPANNDMIYNPVYTSLVTECPHSEVAVYACSAFGSTWTPTTTAPLDIDDEHIIDKKIFRIILSSSAKIDGTITSNLNTVKASPNDASNAYTVTAELSSNASEGMVKNVEMEFKVPIGQVYVPGSAEIEYPIGTTNPLPSGSTLESVLTNTFGPASDDSTARSARLKLNDTGLPALGNNVILPGASGNPPAVDTVKRTARIRMKFRALCSTQIFDPIKYSGIVYGKNICGGNANGDGVSIVSQNIKPDINYDYDFEMQIAPQSATSDHTSFAFNEGYTRDTLKLTIKRHYGSAQDMKSGDYLAVELPKELDIDSFYIHYKGVSGSLSGLNKRDSIVGNTIVAGVRTLKLPFPISEYNIDATKGYNSVIHCFIPVIYTPDGQTRAGNPIDSIRSSIRSTVTFKGGCPDVPMKLGLKTQKVALFTAVEYPHIAWIGDTARFQITSHGFDGKWYKEKTGGIVANTENPWINIPTDTAMVGDTVFYFTPVINNTEYGNGNLRLPYRVRIWLRPWFIKNLDTMKYICTDHDTLRVKAGGMDVSYRWYKDGDSIAGATDTFFVVTQPGKYHVMVKDTVTPPNIISSDTMNVYFREFPVITKDLKAPRRDCDRLSYVLEVGTQGHHLLYQWYRNGLPIPGAHQRSYRALAKDSSGFYRVTVKNICGDSISSRQCYISFCDEKISGIGRRIELIVPNTAETTPPANGLIYVNSRQDFVFTIKARKGYSVKYMTITTDSPIWTEFSGGIQRTMLSDSVVQVRIQTVTRDLKVTVSGITPLANTNITEQPQKAWAHKGKLYVETERNETVYIYTVTGQLYKREDAQAGLNVFDLESGYYIIRLASGYSGKVFIE